MSDTSKLEVWLDGDGSSARLVGTLAHDRGQVRFQCHKAWLPDPRAFALDPHLSLGDQRFFPKAELGNFGVFLDSSPDRWGQTRMKRREALQAKDAGRRPRELYAWDYLAGAAMSAPHRPQGKPALEAQAHRLMLRALQIEGMAAGRTLGGSD